MSAGAGEQPGAPPAGAGAGCARSFQLRFAPQREPGRSYLSAVKPRALPATVTDKFYSRARCTGGIHGSAEAEAAAERRIAAMFREGPRERLRAPLTSAHEVGWWRAPPPPPRHRALPDHRLRDSAWLTARLRVLHDTH